VGRLRRRPQRSRGYDFLSLTPAPPATGGRQDARGGSPLKGTAADGNARWRRSKTVLGNPETKARSNRLQSARPHSGYSRTSRWLRPAGFFPDAGTFRDFFIGSRYRARRLLKIGGKPGRPASRSRGAGFLCRRWNNSRCWTSGKNSAALAYCLVCCATEPIKPQTVVGGLR
jgi:hypothetical protein